MNIKRVFFNTVTEKLFIFSFLFFSLCNSYTEEISSYSKILYEYDSIFYDELHLTSLESGYVWLSYKKPASYAELKLNFDGINEKALSEHGKVSYENLYNMFYKSKPLLSYEQFAFDINLKLALQAQYLYNGEKEPFINKFHRYNKTPEPIAVPFEFYFSQYVYLYCVPVFGKNFSGSIHSYPYTNLPLAGNAMDYHFPKKTGLSIGNKFFNFHIGRGRLNVGRTLSGGMIISDTPDRLDFASASLFFKYVKLDMTVAEINPTRFFISHEISIRPLKQFSVTLHEGIILNSVFDPRFLNPFMIFHNYAPWKDPYINNNYNGNLIGCQLGFDINIIPVKNLRIYGQFGMNQFQTPSELKGGANNIPNSMGGIAGIEYSIPMQAGYLTLNTEFMYADPWLYIGDTGSKNSFSASRKENVYASKTYDTSEIKTWLTNPYGPDTIAAFFKADFNSPHKYRAAFTYRFLCKGENEEKFFNSIDKGEYYYPIHYKEGVKMAKWKTPTGTVSYFHTMQLESSYTIIKNLNINAALSWTIARGKINGHSVDFSTYIMYSLR
ncbi:hypothetical protein [Treponema pedis]|uniref:hypothetical protein n=1 Tax=Treponema pedis TaxID=409322 RepID=UPI0004264F5C|nr:hypothetical protein [Treponema pedis]